MRGLVAGLAVAAWFVACGGPPKPPECSIGSMCWHIQKGNEITALSNEIRTFRRDLGLDLDPPAKDLLQMKGTPVKVAREVCPKDHEVPKTCSDVCILANHICDNAETICIIAKELGPDDDFGQQKCASATASCSEAKKRCCGCSSAPKDIAP